MNQESQPKNKTTTTIYILKKWQGDGWGSFVLSLSVCTPTLSLLRSLPPLCVRDCDKHNQSLWYSHWVSNGCDPLTLKLYCKHDYDPLGFCHTKLTCQLWPPKPQSVINIGYWSLQKSEVSFSASVCFKICIFIFIFSQPYCFYVVRFSLVFSVNTLWIYTLLVLHDITKPLRSLPATESETNIQTTSTGLRHPSFNHCRI